MRDHSNVISVLNISGLFLGLFTTRYRNEMTLAISSLVLLGHFATRDRTEMTLAEFSLVK